MTIDGVSYPIEPPFLVMATQNPIESEGTYNLPEAQLDRFLFKLVVEYPSASEETDILKLHTRGFGIDRGVADQLERGDEPGRGARRCRSGPRAFWSTTTCWAISRPWCGRRGSGRRFRWAPRPAPGVAILRGARAVAAMEGREYVLPDDVQDVLLPALRHRVAHARGRDRGPIRRRS